MQFPDSRALEQAGVAKAGAIVAHLTSLRDRQVQLAASGVTGDPAT